MAKNVSYYPLVHIVIFWLGLLMPFFAFTQDCGCIDCPLPILDQNISTATFVVDGAENNSLTSNQVSIVYLKFSHSYPSELEMKLTSPAGQAVTLIGPQATSSSSIFFGGFNIRFVADAADADPDPGMSNIWNNADLSGINQYVGAYLPHSGSLQNFNTGSVNGEWTLEITDPLLFDTGELSEFVIQFTDQEGIECCQANAGDLTYDPIIACQGADALLLEVEPSFANAAPNAALFGYTYLLTQADVILEIGQALDLSLYPPGNYEVYGLSYDLADQEILPVPNGDFTLADLEVLLSGDAPLLCADLSSSFIAVLIQNGSTETLLQDTICAGQSIDFAGDIVSTTGEYRDTFAIGESCDSIVILNLLVAEPDTTYFTGESCNPVEVGFDTVYLNSIFNCDSLVITQTFLLPSDTIFLTQETCEIELDNQVDTLVLSTPECDSIFITTLFFETPDTIFSTTKTCDPSEVGLDTITISVDQSCDEFEIVETILFVVDTSYFSSTTCSLEESGEFTQSIQTDSCDRVEVTIVSYISQDTVYVQIEDCSGTSSGIDTLILSNEFGCDSLVITETILLESDTSRIDIFSCDQSDIGIDTLFLSNENNCDSLVITSTNFSAADTTYISELTCDINLVDPNIQSFPTSTCDSIVITAYIYAAPDTTFLDEVVCDANVPADTTLFQNNLGCDSLVVTTFEFQGSVVTMLTATTCDPEEVGLLSDTLAGVSCDSIINTSITLVLSDTTYKSVTVCDSSQSGIDTTTFTASNGCDSLVIEERVYVIIEPTILWPLSTCDPSQVGIDTTTLVSSQACDSLVFQEYIFTPIETTFLESVFTCDASLVGIDSSLLASAQGCDSLLVQEFIFSAADTTFLDALFTCDSLSIHMDTVIYTTSTCDSIVISSTVLQALDTTFLTSTSCDISTVVFDTQDYTTDSGCDSIVITTIWPLRDSEIIIDVPTSEPALVGLDTTILANQAGCDSLVITNFYLDVFTPDTIYLEQPTCDLEAIRDSTIGLDGELIITIPIPIIIDTTYLFDTTCDANQEPLEIIQELSVDGCDSIILLTYDFVMTDTIFTILNTCEEVPMDTIMVTGADCPIVEITTYQNVSSPITYIDLASCMGPFGETTFNYINSQGCDSVVVQTTIEAPSSETILEEYTCLQFLPNDTLFLTGVSCDSLVITVFNYQALPPSIFETTTCDQLNLHPDTIILESAAGCDSLVIFEKKYEPLPTTQLMQTTCDESIIGLIADTLISVHGCDSIILTEYLLESFSPDFILDVEPPLCSGDANGQAILSLDPEIEVLWIFDSFVGAQRSDLSAGIYDLVLSNGLCDTSIQIEIPQSPGMSIDLVVDYILCSSTGGIIYPQVSGGTTPHEYLWEDGSQDSMRTSLTNGSYVLSITDAQGCTKVDSTIIDNVTGLDFLADIQDVTCYGFQDGVIAIDLLSGTAPYVAIWADGSTELVRENLAAGLYSCTINDANLCNITLNRLVQEPLPMMLSLDVNMADQLEVTVTGGTQPYTYQWNDGTTGPVISDPTPGFGYEVTVTDANDCVASIDKVFPSVAVSIISEHFVQVFPNPSSAQLNLSFDGHLTLRSIFIYNIHGQLVYTADHLLNKTSIEIAPPPLPSGAYLLKAHFKEGVFTQKIIRF